LYGTSSIASVGYANDVCLACGWNTASVRLTYKHPENFIYNNKNNNNHEYWHWKYESVAVACDIWDIPFSKQGNTLLAVLFFFSKLAMSAHELYFMYFVNTEALRIRKTYLQDMFWNMT
ncbi:hypothetical protein ACJX0J_011483, partial [Zea mays]